MSVAEGRVYKKEQHPCHSLDLCNFAGPAKFLFLDAEQKKSLRTVLRCDQKANKSI